MKGDRSSEVLLTFGPRFLIQFGRAIQHRSLGDAVFGSQDWQRLYEQMPSDKRTFLVTAYLSTLREAGFTYTLHFELLDEGGHPLFLLFGTKHHIGLHAMKTAMWSVDPVTGARYRDPRDPEQQALDLAWEPDLGPLRRLLLAELGQGPRTIAQLRDFALFETMYRPEQVSTAVDQLRERRQVRATPNHKKLTKSAVVQATSEEPMFD